MSDRHAWRTSEALRSGRYRAELTLLQDEMLASGHCHQSACAGSDEETSFNTLAELPARRSTSALAAMRLLLSSANSSADLRLKSRCVVEPVPARCSRGRRAITGVPTWRIAPTCDRRRIGRKRRSRLDGRLGTLRRYPCRLLPQCFPPPCLPADFPASALWIISMSNDTRCSGVNTLRWAAM